MSQEEAFAQKRKQKRSLTELVDHNSVINLQEGTTLSTPMGDLVIQEKLGQGGEGHSYRAEHETGYKVVKFVTVGNSTTIGELEDKLSPRLARVDKVLERQHNIFPANEIDLAVVGSYVEGRNLQQEVEERKAPYTQAEVVGFLIDIVGRDVASLHKGDLVHGDIKPQNIIVRRTDDGKEYELIDFGNLREEGSDVTITSSFGSGTLAYMRFNPKHEAQDDFYSLSRTAQFLLTGETPEIIAAERFERVYNEEVIGGLDVNDNLKSVLLKMRGHDGNYQNNEELLGKLKKLQKKVSKTKQNIGLDLRSARDIAEYKRRAEMTVDLERKINGIRARFDEKYKGANANRLPLDEEFLSDLNGVLVSLGYERKEFEFEEKDEKQTRVVYIRKRKENQGIDILEFLPEGKEGGKYFSRLVVHGNEEKVETAVKPYERKTEGLYKAVKELMVTFPVFVGGIVGGIEGYNIRQSIGDALVATGIGVAIGFITAGVTGATNYNHFLNSPTDATAPKKERLNEDNSYIWGLFGLTYPHVAGKMASDGISTMRRLSKWFNDGEMCNNEYALEKSLIHAPHFTYKQTS
jgi:serine/threonine protein kinase